MLFGFCESNPSHPTLFFFLLLFSLPAPFSSPFLPSFFPPSPALSLLSPPSSPSLPLLQGLCSLPADSLVGGGGLPAGCPFCPAPLEVAACPARPPQSPPLVQEVWEWGEGPWASAHQTGVGSLLLPHEGRASSLGRGEYRE